MNVNSVIVLFSALVLSLTLTPIVRKLVLRWNVLNIPTEERWHRQPIALLGGIAIFVSFAAAILLRVELSREVMVILLGGGYVVP